MATNPYFKDYSGEQTLVEDLTIEIIKSMGRDMIYIPRDIVTKDDLFGESNDVSFTKGIPLEMYIESVNGFEGQGDIISKFGIEVKDNVTLVLSRKRFENEITTRFSDVKRPREGDLIFFPLSKSLFEINFVEHENPFYQLGKLYSYKLTCELFVYNKENIDTGNSDIDSVESTRQRTIDRFTLSKFTGITYPTTNSTFYFGETVYQVAGITGAGATYGAATAKGVIAKEGQVQGKTGYAYITGITGTFLSSITLGQSIKGTKSELEYYLYNIQGTDDIAIINPLDLTLDGDNEVIRQQQTDNNVFDFTDTDPFSEGKY